MNEERFRIAYHVAPASVHDQILKKGIRARDGKVYVWRDLVLARWYKDYIEMGTPPWFEIWKIDVSGLTLFRDPETVDMSDYSSEFKRGESGHGYLIRGSVSPERLLRVTPPSIDDRFFQTTGRRPEVRVRRHTRGA